MSNEEYFGQNDHKNEGGHNQEPPGLVCHRCGCRHFYVLYTRRRPNGQILRRRECRNCGTRILTIEKNASWPY